MLNKSAGQAAMVAAIGGLAIIGALMPQKRRPTSPRPMSV